MTIHDSGLFLVHPVYDAQVTLLNKLVA